MLVNNAATALRRLLRRAVAPADGPAVGHQPRRSDERHPRLFAGDAPTKGKIISIPVDRRACRLRILYAYSASKFGLDGWMEALQTEVGPFGIQTMIVNPGFFRTELLTQESTQYADPTIDDYADRRAQQEALDRRQRHAGRRSRKARPSAHCPRQAGRTSPPFPRWCRRWSSYGRTGDCDPPKADRCLPRHPYVRNSRAPSLS